METLEKIASFDRQIFISTIEKLLRFSGQKNRKSPIPALRIYAENEVGRKNGLKIALSDGNNTYHQMVPATITTRERLYVPTRETLIAAVMVESDTIDIVISSNGEKVYLANSDDSKKFAINPIRIPESEKYPHLGYAKPLGIISKNDLLTTLNSIAPCIIINDSIPMLNNFRIEFTHDNLRVVGTDRFLLGIKDTPLISDTHTDDFACLAAKKSLLKAVKALPARNNDKTPATVVVSLLVSEKKYLCLTVDDIVICCEVAEEEYLDYRKLTPDNDTIVAHININEQTLFEAVKTTSFRFDSKFIVFDINKEHKSLSVFAIDDQEISINHEHGGAIAIPAKIASDEDFTEMKISFTVSLLLAILKPLQNSGEIYLGAINYNRPLIIKHDSLTYLIMPTYHIARSL